MAGGRRESRGVDALRWDQRRQMLALKAQGMTLTEIGERVGLSRSTVGHHLQEVSRVLRAETLERAEAMREEQNAQIVEIIAEARSLAMEAPEQATKAYTTVVRAMERQAKLFGLDAPERVQMVVSDDMTDEQAAAILNDDNLP